MRNLSLKGLENEASVRNHNLVKNAFFDPNMAAWQVNGGQVPSSAMTILNPDTGIRYAQSYPYPLTLPLLISGGRPPYTWSFLTRTPDAGKIDIPIRSIVGNTVFGTFNTPAAAQVLVQVTDSNNVSTQKLLNIDVQTFV